MTQEGLTGIVCDEGLTKVFCVVDSYIHKRMAEDGSTNRTRIVYIHSVNLREFFVNGMEIGYVRDHMVKE